ncbi:RNA 2'-phosphotransferase [Flectobacillus sp. BAB-3569]|uniref:RNA 2'-phosphotransferase n=1 Tax=Flectobacillus sp. BAB-3569 TaxID=1509483 RepID=UPI000BA3C456|nr:RNA 2'-phosphotransferase [Flectobacillus sp. BAB-3569]PAC29034.1 RNA 2'-phosphotransferase [Flectobacillus sp. BAB-3569]
MPNLTHISKLLSKILRHQPDLIDIQLDENGWVEVSILLQNMTKLQTQISFEQLKEVVDTNNKKRFSFNDDLSKIRANQGHSIEVDLALQTQIPPNILYHGTVEKNLDSIFEKGLSKMNRHHVHLSADTETAQKVGMRHGKPIILTIESKQMYDQGYVFYLSENQVWLTDSVPSEFIRL